jgi:hypothetical protein
MSSLTSTFLFTAEPAATAIALAVAFGLAVNVEINTRIKEVRF